MRTLFFHLVNEGQPIGTPNNQGRVVTTIAVGVSDNPGVDKVRLVTIGEATNSAKDHYDRKLGNAMAEGRMKKPKRHSEHSKLSHLDRVEEDVYNLITTSVVSYNKRDDNVGFSRVRKFAEYVSDIVVKQASKVIVDNPACEAGTVEQVAM